MIVRVASDVPVLSYADRDADRWVPITAYRTEVFVHMAAAKLRAEDKPVTIEDHPQRAGGARPARIRVLADDVPTAVSILKDTPAREFLLECAEETPTLQYAAPAQRERLRPLVFWLLIVDLVVILAGALVVLIDN